MKPFVRLSLLSVLVLVLGSLASCDDDPADGAITIDFLEPTDGATVSDAADVHLHVRFTAEVENDEVHIILTTDTDPGTIIAELDRHTHAAVVDLELDVDLSSYPAGTLFRLTAEACQNHECDAVSEASITFAIP